MEHELQKKIKERDSEAHSTKKGNTWHFGYKAHIGVDRESGLVHHVDTTSANDHDVFIIMQVLLQTKTVDNSVCDFMIKKQSEGKHYYSYMNAAANKFLRIYYARVKEVLTAAEAST